MVEDSAGWSYERYGCRGLGGYAVQIAADAGTYVTALGRLWRARHDRLTLDVRLAVPMTVRGRPARRTAGLP